jgi:hypothetical protein
VYAVSCKWLFKYACWVSCITCMQVLRILESKALCTHVRIAYCLCSHILCTHVRIAYAHTSCSCQRQCMHFRYLQRASPQGACMHFSLPQALFMCMQEWLRKQHKAPSNKQMRDDQVVEMARLLSDFTKVYSHVIYIYIYTHTYACILCKKLMSVHTAYMYICLYVFFVSVDAACAHVI